ncbi:Polar amino acid transport system permease protein OS=Castellaniella defragrans OX=75697 GN=HNR28_000823 PE=3 SV=1 [Castellaniella defragrans]
MFGNDALGPFMPGVWAGLAVTLEVTALSTLIGLLYGLVMAVLRRSRRRWVRGLVTAALEFIRRTPPLIQLYFAFFVLPSLGLKLSGFVCGVFVMGIHTGSYMAEVYRAGIDAVDKGQWEAAIALNYGKWPIWRHIILPQAIPPMIPSLGNYLVLLFKDSALLSTITVLDMMGQALLFSSMTYEYVGPITIVGIIYFLISIPSAVLLRVLEKKLNR